MIEGHIGTGTFIAAGDHQRGARGRAHRGGFVTATYLIEQEMTSWEGTFIAAGDDRRGARGRPPSGGLCCVTPERATQSYCTISNLKCKDARLPSVWI